MNLRYNLTGQLKVGDKVNVERAMAAHTRFGGHMVQVSIPHRLSPVFSDQLPASTSHLPCTHFFRLLYYRLYDCRATSMRQPRSSPGSQMATPSDTPSPSLQTQHRTLCPTS